MNALPSGEQDLQRLLSGMTPLLSPQAYVFTTLPDGRLPSGVEPFATVREDEGSTLVLTRAAADQAALPYEFVAARITLQTHSDLAAVGVTAAVASRLAAAGISCNVIAGQYHDHLFVPRDCAERAMAQLERLAAEGRSSAPDPISRAVTDGPAAGDLAVGWSVRHPREDDHPRVLAVLDDWWGGFGGDPGARERALLLPRLYFEHFTDTSYLVEDSDGRLVAFLIGFLSQARPDLAYVHFVGIDPVRQRSGMGRWLYERFAAAVAAAGAQEIRCITSPGNAASIAFHTRLDFRIEPSTLTVNGLPVHGDHDGPGLHRVVFSRRLPHHGGTP